MTDDVLDFVTFCIGCLARRLDLPQGEVYRRLHDSGILMDYIVPCYDVLHTFGKEYIVEDLLEVMKERGAA